MSLKCGIVGLPNVGKSTLFNALGSAKTEAANYPFCTIEPNIGVFNVPDKRLDEIAALMRSEKVIPANMRIVDIAGIVKGASKGEGLGNQFLAHIREVDAIVHVVRCFENADIVHVDGGVDPRRDIEVIQTELNLADLQTVDKRLDKERRVAKAGDKESRKNVEVFEKVSVALNDGKPARHVDLEPQDRERVKTLCLLSDKPVLYLANATSAENDKKHVTAVENFAKAERSQMLVIDCGIEAEIASLPESERDEYLVGLGLSEPGLHRFIRTSFDMLGLMTFYTAGPKETRAWTVSKGSRAPQAAGQIHSDFERGFICADCYRSEDFLKHKTEEKLRSLGLMRQEGKEYLVQPGDVLFFKFNV